jgi:hypothetical protein
MRPELKKSSIANGLNTASSKSTKLLDFVNTFDSKMTPEIKKEMELWNLKLRGQFHKVPAIQLPIPRLTFRNGATFEPNYQSAEWSQYYNKGLKFLDERSGLINWMLIIAVSQNYDKSEVDKFVGLLGKVCQ